MAKAPSKTSKKEPVIVGAVIYDPKVTVIWNIIREFFEENGFPMDVVFYRTYSMQVKALAEGHIDIAWNSPLAWLDTTRRSKGARAIAMRDTDRDRVSHIVVRKDGPVKEIADLKGKAVALGASDSPQATLIPRVHLEHQGLSPKSYTARLFEVGTGLHGDHVGGEKDAFQALARGEAEASAMLDLNWESWVKDGTIDPARYRILTTTPKFDHCVFAVRKELPAETEKGFLKALFSMSYQNPKHREMMDMEGLKEWLPGRTTGFGPLSEAVEKSRFFQGAD